MKIAVIQASSQKDKNKILFESVSRAVSHRKDEVINFGIYPEEQISYSYIETAVNISLLLESGAVDFAVTGCSSGQGMMLACNSLPGVLCGYVPTPSDAFLFGRINDGNAVSLPLGLNYGWAGELNLQYTLDKLFEAPFGTGFPPKDAERKIKDTKKLKELNHITKRKMLEVLPELDKDLAAKALNRECVFNYIMQHGNNTELLELMKKSR